jgi:predicted lipid carrier protein YhbT
VPPLSPVLLAGLALRPLPPALLQPVLGLAMATMWRRHRGAFERLSGLGEPVFLIDPIDLPYSFVLRTGARAPSLTAISGGKAVRATATIRGPLLALINLVEGRIDGDALFFSRGLVIEGDTEAVVALRNAVDGAEIDIAADMASLLGPLARPARRLAGAARAVFSRLAGDLETLRRAAIAPAMRRADADAARLDRMDEAIAELKRRMRRGRMAKP